MNKSHKISQFFIICAVIFLLLSFTITTITGKICKSKYIVNHVKNLEKKLRNCTEIDGDLKIVLMETTKSPTDYDAYVFPELQKIKGSLILFKLPHLTSLGKLFPNLRLIRGLSLLKEFALVIYDLPDIKEIGTSKLSHIARGGVKIGKTPKLCFGNSVNWTAIAPEGKAQIEESTKCPQCPKDCNGWCWNDYSCQTFTDNCHEECLGCTKNRSNAHCEVCKNFEEYGLCVSECSTDKYLVRMHAICVIEEDCNMLSVNSTEKWFIYGKECRNNCPEEMMYNSSINTCQSCGKENKNCEKYCGKAKLSNKIAIENIRGCTHINGSLIIQNLRDEDQWLSLKDNLQSLRYIRDYLLISRNEVITNLTFLPKLKLIAGVNLYINKSLMVFENRKLNKLFHQGNDEGFLKINGAIGFQDNDMLCLEEIENFARKNKISYNETDVSRYSNGADCEQPLDKNLFITISNINSTNVTLSWKRTNFNDSQDYNTDLYYTIHYTEILTITTAADKNLCEKNNGWYAISTGNNFIDLLDLRGFTIYYYYIETYIEGNVLPKQTPTYSFKTLADDPSFPNTLTADAIDEATINLNWTTPEDIYGILDSYYINVFTENYDAKLIYQRDYCVHPYKNEIPDPNNNNMKHTKSLDELKLIHGLTTEPSEIAYWNKHCGEPAIIEEFEFKLKTKESFIWLNLCDDKNSKNKYGFNYCKNYYYDIADYSSLHHIEKRSSEEDFFTPPRQPSSMNKKFRNYLTTKTLNVTENPDLHNLNITGLDSYTLYIFYVMVCNHNNGHNNERKLCSEVLQTWSRTKKREDADTIKSFSLSIENDADLVVEWEPPEKPNGLILSYIIQYYLDETHAKTQRECVSQQNYLQEKKFVLKKMPPGIYYVRLQAVSLAGHGNFTRIKEITINSKEFNIIWTLIIIILLLCLISVAIMFYLKISTKRKRRSNEMQLIPNINPDYNEFNYRADEWEMDVEDVALGKIIGQGTFGRVYSGRILSRDFPCAVKTVNDEASLQDIIQFLAEANIMKEFTNGPHVVKLFGIVSRTQPPYVVMELMALGDLKRYLLWIANEQTHGLTSNEIYRMAIEIADGLAYLISRKHVHRDIAARNCMVSGDKTVKIGDFGMARDIYQSDYYKQGSGNALLPVRWMAPEAIADGVYTCDTDIWSYGIVLWEIATLASQPYQGLSNKDVTKYILNKKTLERPTECPNLLWEIMERCWNWLPYRRPTCFEIIEILQNNVGESFLSLSFYHSRMGQEYLLIQGTDRINNPPAANVTKFFSEETDPDHFNDDDDHDERYPLNHHRTDGNSEESPTSLVSAFNPPTRSCDFVYF